MAKFSILKIHLLILFFIHDILNIIFKLEHYIILQAIALLDFVQECTGTKSFMHCKFHYFKIGQNWAEGKFLTVAIWYLENLWEKNHFYHLWSILQLIFSYRISLNHNNMTIRAFHKPVSANHLKYPVQENQVWIHYELLHTCFILL